MNGRSARGEPLWIARATTSLPDPVSPKMSTGTSDLETNSIRSITPRRPLPTPTIVSPSFSRPSRFKSEQLVGLGRFAQCVANLRHAAIVLQRNRERLQEHLHQFDVFRLKRGAELRHQYQNAKALVAERQRAHKHVGFDWLRRNHRQHRLRAALVAMEHLSAAAPVENGRHLPGLALTPQIAWRTVFGRLTDGNRLDAMPRRIDTADEDAFDRHLFSQEAGNRFGGLRNLDVPAGLPPNIH